MSNNKLYLEISNEERDYLLRVIDHFVSTNSHLHQDVVADVMMIYWRLHRSKHEGIDNES